MSAPKPEDADKTDTGPDNDSALSADRNDSVTTMAKEHPAGTTKAPSQPDRRLSFLATPQERPLRPTSPSTLSILSNEELDELNSSGQRLRRIESHAMDHDTKREPQNEENSRLQIFWSKHKGVTWALLAQLFGAMMNMAAQELEVRGNQGKGLNAFEILFVRMGITVFFSVLYMWQQRTPHFPFGPREVRWLLVGRALGGFVGVWAMYFSLRYLPVQLAVVITFLAPFLTNFACSKIYGEPFTRTDVVTGMISLIGVILLAHPETLIASLLGGGSPDKDTPPASGNGDMAPGDTTGDGHMSATPAEQGMAVGVALLGVLGSAVAYTTIRVIGKRAHPLISVNYFGFCCFIVSTIMLAIQRHVTLPADPRDWAILAFLGVCGFTMVRCNPLINFHQTPRLTFRSNSSSQKASPTQRTPKQPTCNSPRCSSPCSATSCSSGTRPTSRPCWAPA